MAERRQRLIGKGRQRIEARTRSTKARLRAIASKKRPGARIRRSISRCFIIRGQLITIGQVLRRSYPRLDRYSSWHYLAARRALRHDATVVARCRFGRGRPNLWQRTE